MPHTIEERVIALSAIFMAAKLAKDLATTAQCDAGDYATLLKSVINESPASTLDVYGNDLENIRTGLISLQEHLGQDSQIRDPDIVKYAMGLLIAEKVLSKRPEDMKKISQSIHDVERQLQHFPIEHENISANLAQTYRDTLSQLSFRIMINGNPQYLAQQEVTNKIRATLLAGIRAAVLWRQCGGSRWQLLFKRGKLVNTALALLQSHEKGGE